MRHAFGAVLLLLIASLSLAAPDSPELQRARADAQRIKRLVAEGVLPRSALLQAELVLREAEDEAVLARTLYAELSASELTPELSEAMMNAATALVERQESEYEEARELVGERVVPESYLEPFEKELARRREILRLAETRSGLFDGLLAMVRLEQDYAEALAREEARAASIAERFDGNGRFLASQKAVIVLQFRQRFQRDLPVSADGDTALHRALGFDHRGRLDVALHPDSEEGIWLRELLEELRVPYFAFRGTLPGSSTGTHIHIGPPSGPVNHSNEPAESQ